MYLKVIRAIHTRGPWQIEGEGNDSVYITSTDDSEANGIVCNVSMLNDPDRSMADAKLISEVPEMFDILFSLIFLDDGKIDMLQSTIDRANALMDRLGRRA
jgi:hypothetical protein